MQNKQHSFLFVQINKKKCNLIYDIIIQPFLVFEVLMINMYNNILFYFILKLYNNIVENLMYNNTCYVI